MNKHIQALKSAIPYTIPVLAGFSFLGMSYGFLMTSKGFSIIYPICMSIFVYAGSMQYVAVNILLAPFNPIYAFFITLMVNARHLFYGLSLLKKYGQTSLRKFYMIFSLCDETFSVNCNVVPPTNIDQDLFMFYISLLDQAYWVIATIIGALLGSIITFDTTGIEFVMTALFIVIFVNQWLETNNHLPAFIGLFGSIICLMLFGANNFIIPAMIMIVLCLLILQKPIEGREIKNDNDTD